MSTTTWERNTAGLRAAAHRRKEQALQSVEMAITRLVRTSASINFNTVAKEAGVAKQYLYGNAQIRARIEALRDQQRAHVVRERLTQPTSKTDASKDLLLLAKERRIKALEDEVRRLRRDLQVALGQLYERV
jgi:hypothetical protein